MGTPGANRPLKNYPGTIIIFEHPVSEYRYSPALDIYHINDNRFYDPELYTDIKKFTSVFNENFENALQSRKKIITIAYNSMIARTVRLCLKKFFSDCLPFFPLLSFFHTDTDTAKIAYGENGDPLEDKKFILLDMLNYPDIKKIEIPRNSTITADLLLEEVAEPYTIA